MHPRAWRSPANGTRHPSRRCKTRRAYTWSEGKEVLQTVAVPVAVEPRKTSMAVEIYRNRVARQVVASAGEPLRLMGFPPENAAGVRVRSSGRLGAKRDHRW